MKAIWKFYRDNLLLSIVVGIVLGALVGALLPEYGQGDPIDPDKGVRWTMNLGLLGDIFLSSLKMIVVPLVICSMVTGVASLGDLRQIGGIGSRTIVFYMTTTFLSVGLGMVLVNAIRPGEGTTVRERLEEASYRIDGNTIVLSGVLERENLESTGQRRFEIKLLDQNLVDGQEGEIRGVIKTSKRRGEGPAMETVLTVERWIRGDEIPIASPGSGILPDHEHGGDGRLHEVRSEPPLQEGRGIEIDLARAAKVRGKDRDLIEVFADVLLGVDGSGGGLVPRNLFLAMVRMDILPLIVFSLLLGGALTTIGAKGEPLLALFQAGNEAVMKIVHLLILFAPVGIFGLLAGRIGKAGGWAEFWPELVLVGKYCLTVISGLLLHGIVVLPAILFLFGRRNPFVYAKGMAKALLTAFSTASSSGTLPVTMESTIEKNEVSERTSRFVLPLGATINMDGTALYEAVAAIFIAQVYGIHLDFGQQIVILATATLAAIGAAGIPEAGLVTMVIVLKAVGLPIEGISLILIVDWFLDRCRTTVNVWGDSIGAGVIDRYESEVKPPSPPAAE